MFQLNITEDDTSLEQALAYYDEGYNVVPLQRSNKKPPSFLGSWEQYKETRPSRDLVESWFKDRDNLQVALVCGKFVVVDADSPEAMDWVEKNMPPCPFKVITGKGMHYYYNNPENYTTFATRRTAETPIERLIDIRGVGGLIIAPWNRHANGQVYKPVTFADWKIYDHNDLPDFTEVEFQKITGVPKTDTGVQTAPFSLDGVLEGSRNDQAARIAGYLISKNVNLEFVRIFLQNWNTNNNPPLPQAEIDGVVESVKNTHDRKNQLAPLFTQVTETIQKPKDLFNPPGLLKDMFKFCEDIAQVPIRSCLTL